MNTIDKKLAQKVKANQLLLDRLQKRIGYVFKNEPLLTQALTHRSFSSNNNERFEFIGDSILNYSVAKMLFEAFPKLSEGELSRFRANLVNQDTLAEIAHELELGDVLFLGTGELKSGGFRRPSILSDAMEAMFAAISFDSDFLTAEQVIRALYAERVRTIDVNTQSKDAKTLLQEALQAKRLPLPKYRIIEQKGEAHDQIFVVECDLGELGYQTKASAPSRRLAEQLAAKEALVYLQSLAKKSKEQHAKH
jgi:ribonuclease-3